MSTARLRHRTLTLILYTLLQYPLYGGAGNLQHHMSRKPPKTKSKDSNGVFFKVTNQCPTSIYPGVTTQSGRGADTSGFELKHNEDRLLQVSSDWQGRLWGRTNCSFNDAGTSPANGAQGIACQTGDCNGLLQCMVTGNTPMTLAEFTLNAGDDQTYYDISLVDGYNLPVAIVPQTASGPYFTGSKSNELSPSCMATAALLAPKDFNPYEQFPDFLGTYSSNPLPLETRLEDSTVAQWCPWNLQADRPSEPNGGVYQYPDGDIERAAFNPCFSSCSKWNKPEDCCTGQYDGPHSCSPSEYSKAAKMVCPDAYSYAYDDQTSTFIVPAGSNFEIIFCPGGRSTDIYTKNDTRP